MFQNYYHLLFSLALIILFLFIFRYLRSRRQFTDRIPWHTVNRSITRANDSVHSFPNDCEPPDPSRAAFRRSAVVPSLFPIPFYRNIVHCRNKSFMLCIHIIKRYIWMCCVPVCIRGKSFPELYTIFWVLLKSKRINGEEKDFFSKYTFHSTNWLSNSLC